MAPAGVGKCQERVPRPLRRMEYSACALPIGDRRADPMSAARRGGIRGIITTGQE